MSFGSAESSNFGRRLKHARIDRGMTQATLARGICDVSSVSYWESGRSIPEDRYIVELAERLGIDPSVLTGRGFEPLTATSPESFGVLIGIALDESSSVSDGAAGMALWLQQARRVMDAVDPWRPRTFPKEAWEYLQHSTLTRLSPAALATVSVLNAMHNVASCADAAAISELVDTLTWTDDAPPAVRRRGSEMAAALFLFQGMPYAAQEVIRRVPPSDASVAFTELNRISGTMGSVLDVGETRDSAESQHPGLRPAQDARDAAVRLVRILNEENESPDRIQALAQGLAPHDGYVIECVRLIRIQQEKN